MLVDMAQKNFEDVAVALRDTDSVAVLKRPVKAGDELLKGPITLRIAENIGAGHKIAIREMADGSPVMKYGQIIGFEQGHIAQGQHWHTHNLVLKDFGWDYHLCTEAKAVSYYPSAETR